MAYILPFYPLTKELRLYARDILTLKQPLLSKAGIIFLYIHA